MANSSAVMEVTGSLAHREQWTLSDFCPMEHALDLIGTHSAMVLLREVFWGGRRFDELTRRAGVTEQIAAKRLPQLVEAGLLTKVPYRESGQRTRYEYVLTERGHDLFPVLVSLIEFGRQMQGEAKVLDVVHGDDCGAPVFAAVRCAKGHDVPVSEATAMIARRKTRKRA